MKFVIFATLTVTACLFASAEQSQPATGKVIILNGPSGSGKSSIQREFQKLVLPHLWVKTGIDSLFDMSMPDITPENMELWQSPNPIRFIEKSYDDQGYPIITLKLGPEGDRVAYAMNSAIAAYARNGCNVIVDFICYDPSWMEHLEKELSDVTTYWVAVRLSLDTLEKREANRGTSPIGHARSHYYTVYGHRKYDIEVDSENSSPAEMAQKILKLVEEEATDSR